MRSTTLVLTAIFALVIATASILGLVYFRNLNSLHDNVIAKLSADNSRLKKQISNFRTLANSQAEVSRLQFISESIIDPIDVQLLVKNNACTQLDPDKNPANLSQDQLNDLTISEIKKCINNEVDYDDPAREIYVVKAKTGFGVPFELLKDKNDTIFIGRIVGSGAIDCSYIGSRKVNGSRNNPAAQGVQYFHLCTNEQRNAQFVSEKKILHIISKGYGVAGDGFISCNQELGYCIDDKTLDLLVTFGFAAY